MDVDGAAGKAALRREMRARLAALSSEARVAASALACERLFELDELATARCVFAFLGVGVEIDTRPLIRRLLADGRQVCVPYLGRARGPVHSRTMRVVQIDSLDDCQSAAFGLLEPTSDARAVDPAAVEAVVAPGLAFDRRGARLGQGGGFYDRFLQPWREAAGGLVIGYGFGAQLVARVPCEPHDVRVDGFVSDAGAVRCVD